MSELAADPISRDPAGRFVPGRSGNPAGKAPARAIAPPCCAS